MNCLSNRELPPARVKHPVSDIRGAARKYGLYRDQVIVRVMMGLSRVQFCPSIAFAWILCCPGVK